MNRAGKLATVFAVTAGVVYGGAWGSVGLGAFLTKAPETTAEFSDNGLRVLLHDYRSSSSNGKPLHES